MASPDELVDLDLVKLHLRVTHDDDDSLIRIYIQQATAIVIDYLKAPDRIEGSPGSPSADDWTLENVPRVVQAAILRVIEDLYVHRGGGEDKQAPADGYLPPKVTMLLHRLRDPSLA